MRIERGRANAQDAPAMTMYPVETIVIPDCRPRLDAKRAWRRMAQRIGQRHLPIEGAMAWAIPALGRAA